MRRYTVKPDEIPAIMTAVAPLRFAPVIVTVVPPAAGTATGDDDDGVEIDGGAGPPRRT